MRLKSYNLSGQVLLEVLTALPLAVTACAAIGLGMRTVWLKERCFILSFERAQAALPRGGVRGPPVKGVAHCGEYDESVELPLLEEGHW